MMNESISYTCKVDMSCSTCYIHLYLHIQGDQYTGCLRLTNLLINEGLFAFVAIPSLTSSTVNEKIIRVMALEEDKERVVGEVKRVCRQIGVEVEVIEGEKDSYLSPSIITPFLTSLIHAQLAAKKWVKVKGVYIKDVNMWDEGIHRVSACEISLRIVPSPSSPTMYILTLTLTPSLLTYTPWNPLTSASNHVYCVPNMGEGEVMYDFLSERPIISSTMLSNRKRGYDMHSPQTEEDYCRYWKETYHLCLPSNTRGYIMVRFTKGGSDTYTSLQYPVCAVWTSFKLLSNNLLGDCEVIIQSLIHDINSSSTLRNYIITPLVQGEGERRGGSGFYKGSSLINSDSDNTPILPIIPISRKRFISGSTLEIRDNEDLQTPAAKKKKIDIPLPPYAPVIYTPLNLSKKVTSSSLPPPSRPSTSLTFTKLSLSHQKPNNSSSITKSSIDNKTRPPLSSPTINPPPPLHTKKATTSMDKSIAPPPPPLSTVPSTSVLANNEKGDHASTIDWKDVYIQGTLKKCTIKHMKDFLKVHKEKVGGKKEVLMERVMNILTEKYGKN